MISITTKKKSDMTNEQQKQPSLAEYIADFEGKEYKLYTDTKGIPTIGIGRNLKNKPLTESEITYFMRKYALLSEEEVWNVLKNGIDQQDVLFLFENDLNDAKAQTAQVVPYLSQLSSNIQYVLIDLCFNMGKGGLQKFKKMLGCIGGYHIQQDPSALVEAAYHLLDSGYTLDVKRRAVANAKALCDDLREVKTMLRFNKKDKQLAIVEKWENRV